MRPIVYHVAMTLDRYIAHADGSIDGMAAFMAGPHVDDYLASLATYDTVIMGRSTYTFGYAYGLEPGQPAYPHMRHYVFSASLQIDGPIHEQVTVVRGDALDTVRQLKEEDGTPIYLCGGGAFAGALLDAGLIDELKLKFYPVVLGEGIPLFGSSTRAVALDPLGATSYENGAMLLHYAVRY